MKHVMIALTNSVAGEEAEFLRWYREEHLHDMLAVEGVSGAQLFSLGDAQLGEPLQWQYLALYEIEADDPHACLDEIKRRAGTKLLPISPTLSADMATILFSALTARIAA